MAHAYALLAARHDPADYPNIKVLATAGEPCPQGTNSLHNDVMEAHFFSAVADRWATSGHYYNSCGPTEVSVSVIAVALLI